MVTFIWTMAVLFGGGSLFNMVKKQYAFAVLNGFLGFWAAMILLNLYKYGA